MPSRERIQVPKENRSEHYSVMSADLDWKRET